MKPDVPQNKADRDGSFMAAGLAVFAFVALRFLLVHSPAPILYPDSHAFLVEASRGFDELAWGIVGSFSAKPAGYPIFLKLCGAFDKSDGAALGRVVNLQLALSGVAFAAAALCVARRACRTRRARAAVLVIFGLSSLTWFAGPWDGAILGESLSLSLLLFIGVATCLAYEGSAAQAATSPVPLPIGAGTAAPPTPVHRFSAWWMVMLPLVVLFAQLRDGHLPLIMCLAVGVAVQTIRRWGDWKRPSRISASIWLVMVTALIVAQSRAALVSGRTDRPLANVLSARVLPEPEYFDWLVNNQQFPPGAAAGIVHASGTGSIDQPAIAAWLSDLGHSAYAEFLVTHPHTTGAMAWHAFQFAAEDLTSHPLRRYFEDDAAPTPLRLRLCDAVSNVLTLPHRLTTMGGYAFYWPLAAGLMCIAWIILHRERQASLLAAGRFFLVVMLGQILTTHFFDAGEDSRHNLLAYSQMVVLFWLPLVVVVDDFAARMEAAEARLSLECA